MNHKIVLASQSPRRSELLKGLGIEFEVFVIPGIEEEIPQNIPLVEVAQYLAVHKSQPYIEDKLHHECLVITADTIVVVENQILGKPANSEEAIQMLQLLSGKKHQVITGVALTTAEKQIAFSDITDVSFKKISAEEIEYYVDNFKPFDKAGAYGIQEWIGYMGIDRIEGSYFNVMGFPVHRIYEELKKF